MDASTRVLVLVSTVLVGACAGLAVAEEQVPVFAFDPGNGTVVVTCKTLSTTWVLSDGRTKYGETQGEEKVVFARTKDGYSVTMTASVLKGPTGFAAAVSQAFAEHSLVAVIDSGGRLVSETGLEPIVAKIGEAVPPEAKKFYSAATQQAELLKWDQADWYASVTSFLGHRAKVGEVWVIATDFHSFGDPVLHCYAATKVIGRVTMQGRPCVRVQTITNNDPEELRGFLGAVANTLLAGLKKLSPEAKVSGDSVRVIDPATMIDYGGKGRDRLEAVMSFWDAGRAQATRTRVVEATVTVQPGK